MPLQIGHDLAFFEFTLIEFQLHGHLTKPKGCIDESVFSIELRIPLSENWQSLSSPSFVSTSSDVISPSNKKVETTRRLIWRCLL